MPERQPQHETEHETHLDHEQHETGGGLRYQQATRDPDQSRAGVTPDSVEVNADSPDQQQQAMDFGGPDPAEEAVLQEHGYPKLGDSLNSRVTQVEHGPYAGGTQQGTPETRAAAGGRDERPETDSGAATSDRSTEPEPAATTPVPAPR